MGTQKNLVTIVGSYNVGLFLKGDKHPASGETIIGHTFHEGGGGKGSNQCISCAKLGGNSTFIGCIGNDKYGQDALKLYKHSGVTTDGIIIDESIHTGISVILINENGDNMISVIPGANYKLSKKAIDNSKEIFKKSSIVGFQLENDINVVEYGIKLCSSLGIDVLLDPAPAQPLNEDLYPCLTYIKPNEHEAETLSGIKVTDIISAEKAADWFTSKGVKNVLITLGCKGVVYTNGTEKEFFPAAKVNAVDTTGAGDCFSGALLAGLSSGLNISEGIKFANIAAAISVTRMGVVEAIPTLNEVKNFIK